MKVLLLFCASLLFLALADFPIGYYTVLRVVITLVSIFISVKEIENGINFWAISFGFIAIIFNPLFPVYLGNKNIWLPIDILSGIIFVVKAFTTKT